MGPPQCPLVLYIDLEDVPLLLEGSVSPALWEAWPRVLTGTAAEVTFTTCSERAVRVMLLRTSGSGL